MRTVSERAGGKGINVARVLAALGARTVVSGPAAPPAARSAPTSPAPACPTSWSGSGAVQAHRGGGVGRRRDHVQRGRADGHGDRMGPAGRPRPPAGRRGQLRRALRQPAAGRAHRRLRRPRPDRRRRRRARGDRHRRRRAARGPHGAARLVKPNAAELAAVTGRPIEGSKEALAACEVLRARGAGSVVVSLGTEGLVARTAEGSWQAPPPERVAGNPAGRRRRRAHARPGPRLALADDPGPRRRPRRRVGARPGRRRVRPGGVSPLGHAQAEPL